MRAVLLTDSVHKWLRSPNSSNTNNFCNVNNNGTANNNNANNSNGLAPFGYLNERTGAGENSSESEIRLHVQTGDAIRACLIKRGAKKTGG